jgi:uncharacterized protein (DUF2141 family)
MFMKFFLMALLFPSSFLTPARLTVVVKNVEASKGSVVLAVFNNPNNFLKEPAAQQVVGAGNETMEFFFTLPDGDYAIAIYQDVNNNRQLDKSWLGIPKEPYGFSNNFRPRFSAPGFNDCKLRITAQTKTTIILK